MQELYPTTGRDNQAVLQSGSTQFREFLQEKKEIPKRINSIALGSLNHTETQCASISSLGSVAEQEVLPGHNKELCGVFAELC